MRSDVLSKVGSDTYVALQLAQLLGTLKGGVVSNLDPYDLDAWVKKLAGSESKGRIDSTEAGDGK